MYTGLIFKVNRTLKLQIIIQSPLKNAKVWEVLSRHLNLSNNMNRMKLSLTKKTKN